mgnify:CR=1 FL=1
MNNVEQEGFGVQTFRQCYKATLILRFVLESSRMFQHLRYNSIGSGMCVEEHSRLGSQNTVVTYE